MSYHPVDHLPSYASMHQPHTPHTPQPTFNSYVMLPPLRPVAAAAKLPTLTLSDCSELSASNSARDDAAMAALNYQPPSSGAMSRAFQLVHADAASRSPVGVLPPSAASDAALPPSAEPFLRPSHRAAPSKKVARARACAPAKAAEPVAVAPPPFKPIARKKVRSSKSNIPGKSRYWTPSEHKLFVQALLKYGPKDLKSISACVGTRDMTQCRTHEQKCFMRLMRAAQTETLQRNEKFLDLSITDDLKAHEQKVKQQKDVYSVPSSCGITLLCIVIEEMARSLQS